MTLDDLKAFQHVPFLVWVKDENWRYVWGNDTINRFAKQDVAGKTDEDLPWADNAAALVAHDKSVLDSGTVGYMHERVDDSNMGKATLSVCKWVDELDGQRRVFGISFVIPDND